MQPRTIGIGKSQQNGDVESLNGVLKRRLEQRLLLRGSRDFASVVAYVAWLEEVLEKANDPRREKLAVDLAAMRPAPLRRLPAYREVDTVVTSWGTVRVRKNTYSVPSRLIGERVRVRVYDERLEILHGGVAQLEVERLAGRNRHRIEYRHVIGSLVRKPWAFVGYRYREARFPTLVFRRAHEALRVALAERRADVEYLRILHRAARTLESEVEAALEMLLEAGQVPLADRVAELVEPERPLVPELAAPVVELASYDALLEEVAA
jgi:hypothetical protein